MLNLKVKEGDYFMIGDDIRIYVQQQKGLGNRVQLAIDAPRSVAAVSIFRPSRKRNLWI